MVNIVYVLFIWFFVKRRVVNFMSMKRFNGVYLFNVNYEIVNFFVKFLGNIIFW